MNKVAVFTHREVFKDDCNFNQFAVGDAIEDNINDEELQSIHSRELY